MPWDPAAPNSLPQQQRGDQLSIPSINRINLAKPDGGRTIVDSTSVLIILHSSHEKTPAGAGARGLLQAGRQGPRRPHESHLAAVELHHQQFVDFEGHPLALDAAIDLGGHLGLIELQVGWHVGQAGKGQVAFG